MFGIEANAQAVAFVRGIDHIGDLLETVAEIGALTRGDFERDLRAITWTRFVNFVQRPGDCLDALRFSRADVGAGMSD